MSNLGFIMIYPNRMEENVVWTPDHKRKGCKTWTNVEISVILLAHLLALLSTEWSFRKACEGRRQIRSAHPNPGAPGSCVGSTLRKGMKGCWNPGRIFHSEVKCLQNIRILKVETAGILWWNIEQKFKTPKVEDGLVTSFFHAESFTVKSTNLY